MFKIYLLFTLLIAAVGLTLLIYPCSEKDHDIYQALQKSSNPLHNKANTFSQLQRCEVRKRIWYQGDTPLQILIESPESSLFLSQKNNGIEVMEELRNVVCIMQEELYYDGDKPMQKIRYMEGEKAYYNYNSNLFVAQNVKLWKYHSEGHTLSNAPPQGTIIMSAIAHSVEFILNGDKPNFTAHQMRATFNTNEYAL